LLMAKEIDETEAQSRLEYYLQLEAELILKPSPLPLLH